MPAYIIADIEVTDPEGYEDYKKAAGPSVAAFGGRYVARGGAVEILEGDWVPKRFVMVEFDSLASAKAWYGSQEYEAAKEIRQRTAVTHMILFEG
jgi:uncharacterized protein (DUF1330 family)